MLGYIAGKLISKNIESQHAVVLTGGVGYEIVITRRTAERIPLQADTALWLHTHVREDVFTLFGFESEEEKALFRTLISVSGLGPKTGLALLSEYAPETLAQLIITKRIADISKAPGVGKKIAERLTVELATKLEKQGWSGRPLVAETPGTQVIQPVESQLRDDLQSALVNLRYQPAEVKQVLDRMFNGDETESQPFEICLKQALKELSSRFLGKTEPGHA